MDNLIFDFLSNYISLTDKEKEIISEQNVIQTFKKSDILLAEGEVAKTCFFILQGCVSSYYLIDGDIKITDFFTEQDTITPISYTKQMPSEHYLECIEDCIIAVGTPERNAKLMQNLPRLAALAPTVLADQLANEKLKHDDLIKFTPKERYLKLQEQSPQLLNRVPQYMIASYLGIKPETLSRIRKRLFD